MRGTRPVDPSPVKTVGRFEVGGLLHEVGREVVAVQGASSLVRIGRYRSDPSVEVVVKEMVYSGSDTKKAVRREVAVMSTLLPIACFAASFLTQCCRNARPPTHYATV